MGTGSEREKGKTKKSRVEISLSTYLAWLQSLQKMVAGLQEALISESSKYEAQNATAAPNKNKKSFHFLISWKQWTGTVVSFTALPLLAQGRF